MEVKKLMRKAFAVCSLAGMTMAFFTVDAQVKNTYPISKDYTVTIQGTSNLHSWNETVEKVSGNVVVNWNKDGSFDVNAITIKMDVHSIKSDVGSVMNNNTYKALKADSHPEIIFALNAPVKNNQIKSDEMTIAAKGSLNIAGVTRPVDMMVKVLIRGNRKLIFEGSQTIKMSDFDIAPPTALFGTLKTGNEVAINFKTGI